MQAGALRLRTLMTLLAVAKAAPSAAAAGPTTASAAAAEPSWIWVLLSGAVGQALVRICAAAPERPDHNPSPARDGDGGVTLPAALASGRPAGLGAGGQAGSMPDPSPVSTAGPTQGGVGGATLDAMLEAHLVSQPDLDRSGGDEAHALCMTEAPSAAEGPRALWAWARLQLAAALLRAWAGQPRAQASHAHTRSPPSSGP